MPKAYSIANEAEWHSIRSMHIGGSEIASLFYRWLLPDGEVAVLHCYEQPPAGSQIIECCSPYTTGYRLWQEKAGVLPPSFVESERVDAGTFLEPALAAWAMKKWDGFPLRKVRRYIGHDSVEGWGASFDYEVHGAGVTGRPVEFKNVDFLVARDSWLIDGEEIVVPPLNLLLQVQHQIGAGAVPSGWIVACVGGNKLCRGEIQRHEPTQAKLAAAIAAFWEGVRANEPPAHVADYETVKVLLAEGDKAAGTADLSDNEELPSLCSRLQRLRAHMERMEAREENLKGRIGLSMGHHTSAKAGSFRISWPSITRPDKVIPERFQPALTYRGALKITKKD